MSPSPYSLAEGEREHARERDRAPESPWWWRVVRPRRTIWPTRDGWWCLFVVTALGVAAINTGNNLLYLLVSLLLSLIIVSGILSEQSMRGLRLSEIVPEDLHAGQPALFGATVTNRKRWLTSYSVTVQVLSPRATPRFIYVSRLAAGADRLVTWQETFPRRGRHRLAGVRVTTRFPFGFFVKAGRPLLRPEVIVFPSVTPVGPDALRELGALGTATTRRRGRGAHLYNLRGYRAGDDPRLIHWRSTAKTQVLMVRETEAETTEDTRLVLVGAGRDPQALEAGLAHAASLATHLVRLGAGVELTGPGVAIGVGRGPAHLRRVLTALALYDPGAPQAVTASLPLEETGRVPLREIRVGLGR